MPETKQVKKVDDLPEIVGKEGFLQSIVCTSIPPERKQEIPDKFYMLVGSPGTSHGRWELDNDIEPVECPDYEGRWHYVLCC